MPTMNNKKLNLNEIAGVAMNFVKALSRDARTEVTRIQTNCGCLNMRFTYGGTKYALVIHEENDNADQN